MASTATPPPSHSSSSRWLSSWFHSSNNANGATTAALMSPSSPPPPKQTAISAVELPSFESPGQYNNHQQQQQQQQHNNNQRQTLSNKSRSTKMIPSSIAKSVVTSINSPRSTNNNGGSTNMGSSAYGSSPNKTGSTIVMTPSTTTSSSVSGATPTNRLGNSSSPNSSNSPNSSTSPSSQGTSYTGGVIMGSPRERPSPQQAIIIQQQQQQQQQQSSPLQVTQGSTPAARKLQVPISAPMPIPQQISTPRQSYRSSKATTLASAVVVDSSSASSSSLPPILNSTTLPPTSSSSSVSVAAPLAVAPLLPSITQAAQTTGAAPSLNRVARFTWRVARWFVTLRTLPAETFQVNGVPFLEWRMTQIPTLGASPTSCRVQQMFKAVVPAPGAPSGRDVKLFVKCVPIDVWRLQWEEEDKWNGEYATDGENFVMEAAVLAFLHEFASTIAPRLVAVLEITDKGLSRFLNQQSPTNQINDNNVENSNSNNETNNNGATGLPPSSMVSGANNLGNSNAVTHIAVVSELYGEDLLDYVDRRERCGLGLSLEERRVLQRECVTLLQKLHQLGLAHLDFTPENILVGPKGLRLCDFAKTTPLWSPRLRHALTPKGLPVVLPGSSGAGASSSEQHSAAASLASKPSLTEKLCAFESCEPTVGKGAYMPPECWNIYYLLERKRILTPLRDLNNLLTPEGRAPYYFRVSAADVYMAGVVVFWIWSDGNVWRYSDCRQDEKYQHLVKSGMNFELFRECKMWPKAFRDLISWALQADPWRRATLADLLSHPWFAANTSVVTTPTTQQQQVPTSSSSNNQSPRNGVVQQSSGPTTQPQQHQVNDRSPRGQPLPVNENVSSAIPIAAAQ